MDEQEQRIEVHAYFVRFKSECYYALIVGKKSEAQQWFAKYADASTFLNTQNAGTKCTQCQRQPVDWQ